jgi:hypothetical protein
VTLKKTYSVINNQIIIDLPENFKGKKSLTVTIEDNVLSKEEKFNIMKLASKFPLFLADISDITEDFKDIDNV